MSDLIEMPDQVADVFDGFQNAHAKVLRKALALILKEAKRLNVGPVTETLKWGQPSYAVRNGTPLRLGLLAESPALFVHCQTDIIENARALIGGVAEFSGNRALILGGDPRAETHVICAALIYHQRGA
ncbi:DUF1801 domain-containing protein [Litoreibacter sp.]|nr:DUF1801 domain-containing protein [Litoreibacter sp.]